MFRSNRVKSIYQPERVDGQASIAESNPWKSVVAVMPRLSPWVHILLTACTLLYAITIWNLHIVQAKQLGIGDPKTNGIVEAMPSGGLIGAWTISGIAYQSNGQSEIRADKGPLVIGACVEVEYAEGSAPFLILKLRTEEAEKCQHSTSTPDGTSTPSVTTTSTPNTTSTGTPEKTATTTTTPDETSTPSVTTTSAPNTTSTGTPEKTATTTTTPDETSTPSVTTTSTPSTTSTGTPEKTTTTTTTPDETSIPSVTTTSTPSPTSTGTSGVEREVYGHVEQIPGASFIGTWVVDGVRYLANGATEFKQQHGPLVVDSCVKIHYFTGTEPFIIREIETEPISDCPQGSPSSTPSGTGTPTPDSSSTSIPIGTSTPMPSTTSTPSNEVEIYGRVDSMPDGLVGEWGVDGVIYQATATTEFKQDHGAFGVGVCVKIHLMTNTSPTTIREIETEQDFRCGTSDNSNPEGELFGVLQSFPENLVGAWNIGGMTFIADSNTEFKQENGPFAAGSTVKVHFSIDTTGQNHAREIETVFANDVGGNDDDGNGAFEGAEGHAFGRIDSFPNTLSGSWTISGIAYIANANTLFQQNDGVFNVGVQVKVEYFLDADGNRIAQKIETTSDSGGATAQNRFKLFGFVNQMPPSGFSGQWVVDNIAFVADVNTQFKEHNGLLGLGAYVGIEYFFQDGRNQMHEIETHVPPGGGNNDAIGVIETIGPVRAAQTTVNSIWVINGIRYQVSAATDMNEQMGSLVVGATAKINSYTPPTGDEIATQILGITINNELYLPVIQR